MVDDEEAVYLAGLQAQIMLGDYDISQYDPNMFENDTKNIMYQCKYVAYM